jgi:hypothetical protein
MFLISIWTMTGYYLVLARWGREREREREKGAGGEEGARGGGGETD